MPRNKQPRKVQYRIINLSSVAVVAWVLFLFFISFFKKGATYRQCSASSVTPEQAFADIFSGSSDPLFPGSSEPLFPGSSESNVISNEKPDLLVISLNFKEEESWLREWLVRTSWRLRSLPFGVIISAASKEEVESLKKVVSSISGPVFVLFSEPFAKGKIGPFLLEGHRRNLELALKHSLSRRLTHAMLLASNCAFVRDVTGEKKSGAVQLSKFVEKNPAWFGQVSTPWHWAPAVFADSCLLEWRRRVDRAVVCEEGSICSLGKSPSGLAIGETGLFAAVSEGFVANHDALMKLLPLLNEYIRIKLASSTTSPRFRITVGKLVGGFWGVREEEGEYPAEEVVLATAVALITTRKGLSRADIRFSHTLRAFFEFGRAIEFTPTREELKALMDDPEGLLLAKRVPRDANHPLWRLAAGEEL